MTGITIEHAQIVRWTQNRGGRPALEKAADYVRPAICFENEGGENVSWDEWISMFDRDQWAFIYQDRNDDGERSRTWRIIPRFASEPAWECEIKNTAA
jgi:hypothetical protein